MREQLANFFQGPRVQLVFGCLNLELRRSGDQDVKKSDISGTPVRAEVGSKNGCL